MRPNDITQPLSRRYVVMREAHAYENMRGVRRDRPTDEVNRDNLKLLEEACARVVGKARGGQIYLARLIGSPASHLSAIRHAGRTGRKMGPEFKEKVETRLNLGRGWMDDAHDVSVVAELARKLSSLPRPQSEGRRAFQPGYGQLVDKILELERQISELRSQSGSRSNTRK